MLKKKLFRISARIAGHFKRLAFQWNMFPFSSLLKLRCCGAATYSSATFLRTVKILQPNCFSNIQPIYLNLTWVQWVETNPSNIRICPTDIRFAAWWYYADGIDMDVKYGCLRMLDWLVSIHPNESTSSLRRMAPWPKIVAPTLVTLLSMLASSIGLNLDGKSEKSQKN